MRLPKKNRIIAAAVRECRTHSFRARWQSLCGFGLLAALSGTAAAQYDNRYPQPGVANSGLPSTYNGATPGAIVGTPQGYGTSQGYIVQGPGPSNGYPAAEPLPQPYIQSQPSQPQTLTPQGTLPPAYSTGPAFQGGVSPAVTLPAAPSDYASPYASQTTTPNQSAYFQPEPPLVSSTGAALGQPLQSLDTPWTITDPIGSGIPAPYQPRIRDIPLEVYVQEAQTGRFVLGGSVNTDLGVAGQIIVEERNFDLFRLPSRGNGLFNGAFRGGGQNFRLEAVPGNRVQRYALDITEPSLFGYSPFSLSTGLFYFNRLYRDYDEQRIGARIALGYVVTPDLQVSTEVRAEDVKIYNPRINGVAKLDDSLGSTDMYTARLRLTHNTRNSPFLPTQGHHFELILDQVFGEVEFPRAQVNFSRYFTLRERADKTGRHVLTTAYRLGFSGEETPIFENFFAGGFSTMRGFRFRGASPVDGGVQVGGRFQFLGSLEYMFPLTADDMLRGVAFVDYGTVERDIEINWDNFRIAPGLGLRIAVPALGPAPLAFDFSVPIIRADTDENQLFSFSAGITR